MDNRYQNYQRQSSQDYDSKGNSAGYNPGEANTRLGRLNAGVPGYEIFVNNVSFDSTANEVVNQFRHCG